MTELEQAFENDIINLRTFLHFNNFIKHMQITIDADGVFPLYILQMFKACVDSGKIPGAGKATSQDLHRWILRKENSGNI